MAMHSMSFAFMSEETCGRGKSSILARFDLASVWLQVRVDKFAILRLDLQARLRQLGTDS